MQTEVVYNAEFVIFQTLRISQVLLSIPLLSPPNTSQAQPIWTLCCDWKISSQKKCWSCLIWSALVDGHRSPRLRWYNHHQMPLGWEVAQIICLQKTLGLIGTINWKMKIWCGVTDPLANRQLRKVELFSSWEEGVEFSLRNKVQQEKQGSCYLKLWSDFIFDVNSSPVLKRVLSSVYK